MLISTSAQLKNKCKTLCRPRSGRHRVLRVLYLIVTTYLFLLIVLGVLLLPVVGAVLLFRWPLLKTRRLKPVRILTFLIVLLLPFYWVGVCVQIFPLPPLGDEVAPEAYRFYRSISVNAPLPNQLVGGGYRWFSEGADLWIRFRSEEQFDVHRENLPMCDSERVLKMSKWFSKRVRTSQDQEHLTDYANLICSGSEGYSPIKNDWLFEIPPPPRNCTESWKLQHIPTQFVYYRVRCDVI